MVLVNVRIFEKHDSVMFQHQRSSVNSRTGYYDAGMCQNKGGTLPSSRGAKDPDLSLQRLLQLLQKPFSAPRANVFGSALHAPYTHGNACIDKVLVLQAAFSLATLTPAS